MCAGVPQQAQPGQRQEEGQRGLPRPQGGLRQRTGKYRFIIYVLSVHTYIHMHMTEIRLTPLLSVDRQ